MMIDFIKVEEITMLYLDKEKLECNAYVQIANTLKVNDENETIKVTMISEKNREMIDPFDLIVKKMDGRYWIKSDYFEEESEYYPLGVYKGEDAYILVYNYIDARMYIQLYNFQN